MAADVPDQDISLGLGFLLGNINEHGELEDNNLLDKVVPLCCDIIQLLIFGVLGVMSATRAPWRPWRIRGNAGVDNRRRRRRNARSFRRGNWKFRRTR